MTMPAVAVVEEGAVARGAQQGRAKSMLGDEVEAGGEELEG